MPATHRGGESALLARVCGGAGSSCDRVLASRWAVFRYIELPKMKGVLLIAILLRFMDSFMIYTEPFVLTGGGPGIATETISVYIYKVTQQDLIWGYVAAIALAILVTLSIVTAIAIARLRKDA